MAVIAPPVTVALGSVAYVDTPSSVTSLAELEGPPSSSTPGLSAQLDSGALAVAASLTASPGPATLTVHALGCTASGCGQQIEISVPVTIRSLQAPAGALGSLTDPSPERMAQAQENDLVDELVVTVGTPDAPGTRQEAESAADAVDGVVSGGIEGSGIYQIRWLTPQDLSLRQAELEAISAVTSVSYSSVNNYGPTDAYPVASPFDSSEFTWPYQQVHATEAWAQTTGGGVTVGVIDEADVYRGHEDLNVAETIGKYVPPLSSKAGDPAHASHVAGLACARNNTAENGGAQLGMVGMAWGCPIVSAATRSISSDAMLNLMKDMASKPSVRVVNISLGNSVRHAEPNGKLNMCANQHLLETLEKESAKEDAQYRAFFAGPEGRKIVWVTSAGNSCAPVVANAWGTAGADLPNVITVAATNSNETLAVFSDYGPGVKVAAPGGFAMSSQGNSAQTQGLMSSVPGVLDCPDAGYCPSILCQQTECSEYEQMAGTSMASPIVAGIAALTAAKNPGLSADQVGACVTESAGAAGTPGGSDYTTGQSHVYPPNWLSSQYEYVPVLPEGGTIPIVDAAAAVECTPPTRTPLGSWSSPSSVDPSFFGSSTSCVSESFCVAVDSDGKVSIDRNGSWTRPALVDSDSLDSVSCVSETFCMAAGYGSVVSFNGSTWSAPESIDLGASWPYLQVSCAQETFCAAVDLSGRAFVYTGTWSEATQVYPVIQGEPGGFTAISCAQAGHCMAVNESDSFEYSNGAWGEGVSVGSAPSLASISCTSSSRCLASGRGGEVFEYNGGSWGSGEAVDSEMDAEAFLPTSISCSSTRCAMVNGDGRAFVRSGGVWSPAHAIEESSWDPVGYSPPSTLTAVSCPESSFCLALDGIGNAFALDSAGSWSATDPIGGGIDRVSCAPGTRTCAMVDITGRAMRYVNGSWSQPEWIDRLHKLNSVSCPTSEFCVAVDQEGGALVLSNGHWGSREVIDSPQRLEFGGLTSVSCSSPSFCVAVDYEGSAVIYSGGSWGKPESISSAGEADLTSVSCSASTFCVAVGDDGRSHIFRGASWEVVQDDQTGEGLGSVSCVPASTFCMSVDLFGHALDYAGGAWHTSTPEGGGYPGLLGVSCASKSFCVAISDTGNAYAFDGFEWTKYTEVDWNEWNGAALRPPSLESISCPGTSFCLAADFDGQVVGYEE